MRKALLLSVMLLLVVSGGALADHHETTFTVTIDNISGIGLFENTGVAAVPVDADGAGPALPGGAYEFVIQTHAGDTLTFATMFAESNDLFFAPDESGIALYDMDGNPVSGDVSAQVQLWDAGTERNQPIGVGDQQALRQAAPNTGTPGGGIVRLASDLNDGLDYPPADEIVAVTITAGDMGEFIVRIDNVSNNAMSPTYHTPITPVVWVVESHDMDMMMHDDDMDDDDMADDDDMMADDDMDDDDMADDDDMMDDDNMMMDDMMMVRGALFTGGQPDYGYGLEALAEDGDPAPLAMVLGGGGLATPLAPVVWAVHDDMLGVGVFFTTDEADRGDGLEALAEDGNPGPLAASLMDMNHGVQAVPDGADGPGPAFPGSAYSFTVTASPGEYLSFATMFVHSNDLFYGPDENGIALFDDMDHPIEGRVTRQIDLWDAGTEVNQEPGVGADQAPRQAGANTGADEMGVVQLVEDSGDGYTYASVPATIRVTIAVDMMG